MNFLQDSCISFSKEWTVSPNSHQADLHTVLFCKKQMLACDFWNYLNSQDLSHALSRLQSSRSFAFPFFLWSGRGQERGAVLKWCWSSMGRCLGSLEFQIFVVSEVEVTLEMIKANALILQRQKWGPEGEGVASKVSCAFCLGFSFHSVLFCSPNYLWLLKG